MVFRRHRERLAHRWGSSYLARCPAPGYKVLFTDGVLETYLRGGIEGKGMLMSSGTLIIVIVVLVLLFGGGGGYYWSRRR